MDHSKHPLHGKLDAITKLGTFLGDTRIRLLEAIDKQGTVAHAAQVVPLSNKAVWEAIDAMNDLADQPLVIRPLAGSDDGAALTEYGRNVVRLFRAMEAEYQSHLDHLAATMNNGQARPLDKLRR